MSIKKRPREYVPRENAGGNFCGHDPLNPRLDLPVSSTDKRRPRLIEEFKDRVKQYFANPSRLPSLNGANNSSRQQRSERRESCLLATAAIVEFLDIASMRCGVPTAEGFISLSIEYLARFTGMGQRRMERAVADLKAANCLSVFEICQMSEDGSTYRGIAAIKTVNVDLFAAFGLQKWLAHERKRATVRLQKKAKKAGGTVTQWARTRLALQGITGARSSKQDWTPPQARTDDFKKAVLELRLAIKHEHPGWTGLQVEEEVQKLLRTRFSA